MGMFAVIVMIDHRGYTFQSFGILGGAKLSASAFHSCNLTKPSL
jgi:hypothetical protein